jgi:hypothetical protein
MDIDDENTDDENTESNFESNDPEKQPCRVHLDPLHAMMRITKPIAKQHPLRSLFQRALRDAIFRFDEDDVKKVAAKLPTDTTFEKKLLFDPKWIFKRVKRYIGPSNTLKESLIGLKERFTKDEFTTMMNNKPVPLLSKDSINALNELIEKHCDCLCDPTECSLYFKEGEDSLGLPLYHCVRGTNSVESYHQWLERMFTPWCQGPELSDAVFTILRHSWNVHASEKHRPNFPKVGHTSHWILDQIQRSTAAIFGKPYYSYWRHSLQDKYVMSETFGIVPNVAENAQFKESDIVDLLDASANSSSLYYICKKMRSAAPILPVLTIQEKQLFRDNVANFYVDRSKKVFDFEKFAQEWNQGLLRFKGDRQPVKVGINSKIFKKLPSLLEQHFKNFQKITNMVAEQKLLSKSVREFQNHLKETRSNRLYVAPGQAVPLDTDVTLLNELSSEDEQVEVGQENYENDIMIPEEQSASTISVNPTPSIGTPLEFVSPSAMLKHSTFDYAMNHRSNELQKDKRKRTGGDRTIQKCKSCRQTKEMCRGITLLTTGATTGTCTKPLPVIHPIPIASIPKVIPRPLSIASSQLGARSVLSPLMIHQPFTPNSSNQASPSQVSNSSNIVSTQASLTPSLVSKTSVTELNGCLHGMYGNDLEIAWQERTVYDMAYLSSIQSTFNSNDAFLIGFWIDKMKRAIMSQLQK